MREHAYIVDNWYSNEDDSCAPTLLHFTLNGVHYCIREVTLEWGVPQLPIRIDDMVEPHYYIFDTYEDALDYVNELMRINGR